MPSFPTNNSSGVILGKVGDWLKNTFLSKSEFNDLKPHEINIRAQGATGYSTPADSIVLDAVQQAFYARRGIRAGITVSTQGETTIYLPAGEYRFAEVRGLLGREFMDQSTNGIRFRGDGRDLTQVIYDPATDGPLAFNDFWLNVAFEGISFSTARAGVTFMESHTTHYAQQYTFTDVSWSGPWKYIFDLQGNNNNSEFSFYACSTSGMQAGGSFLHVGTTNTSDQFLNYWFFGFKHWSTSAALIDAARGGHFHLFGVDASDWGGDLTAPGYLINLRGSSHSAGVQTMSARGLRVEAKSSFAGMLYSEWGSGNVSIECDWSSQTFAFTYGDIIYINTLNESGAIYHFENSNLAGGVQIEYGASTFSRQPIIHFDHCGWAQRLTPSEVVSYDDSSNGGNKARPSVQFTNCRSQTYTNPFHADGASVWDAVVGYNYGPLVKTAPKRSIILRAIYGSLADSDGSMKVNLPVGALITGLKAVSPPVNMPDSDGGSWSLATTEATPTTLATVTVTGDMSPGFSVTQDLPVPYHCSTRERATVTLTSTGVLYGAEPTFVTVEGYW